VPAIGSQLWPHDLHCQIDEAAIIVAVIWQRMIVSIYLTHEMRGGPPLAQRGLREQQTKSADAEPASVRLLILVIKTPLNHVCCYQSGVRRDLPRINPQFFIVSSHDLDVRSLRSPIEFLFIKIVKIFSFESYRLHRDALPSSEQSWTGLVKIVLNQTPLPWRAVVL
jgi:hypothetical protein